jgi:hypothetical protein
MQQKTEGRVAQMLSKHLATEDQTLEQWFLVAFGDDEAARNAVAKTVNAGEGVIE